MQKSAPVRVQALPLDRFPARRPATLLSAALLPAAMILAAVILAGCTTRAPLGGVGGNAGTSKAAADTRQQARDAQFADIPVLKGWKINNDKTMVVGTDVWYGQLTFDTNHSAHSMFDFYARELPDYGWRKITSVRAQTSFMTYDRENRIMTVAIKPNRILGSEVMISVSPRDVPRNPAPPPAAAPPVASPLRAPPVTSRPLAPAPLVPPAPLPGRR